MHPEPVYRKAQELLAAGCASTQIARRLNLPRSTVENWRRRPRVRHLYALEDFADWRPPAASTYAYLLGLYLGDGCIGEHVRGSSSTRLIHPDGCRCINRFKIKLPSGRIAEYEYVRYFFSNLSEDIKDIFCRHADQLGIRWSRANPRYVSIHDRKSVAILDSFVGPKR